MDRYKQIGYNNKYPIIVETWKIGEKIPDWLSDVSKVSFIDGNGDVTLDWIKNDTGGVEIKDSTGINILIKTDKATDIICKDINNSNIFHLSKEQFDLLYEIYY